MPSEAHFITALVLILVLSKFCYTVFDGLTPGPSMWEEPYSGRCSAYATRRFEARLYNEASWGAGLNWMAECKRTPIVIEGIYFANPHECIFRRNDGVYGVWNVRTYEGICMPYWSILTEEGCTAPGSGRRRWYARLLGLQVDDGDSRICMTTPTDLHGRHYDGPTFCENKGWLLGKWGVWDLPDPFCADLQGSGQSIEGELEDDKPEVLGSDGELALGVGKREEAV